MFEWIWLHIVGPALNAFFSTDIGLVFAIAFAGAIIGLAFKFFGWRGVLGAAIAVATFGVYRAGWKARDSLAPHDQSIKPPGPTTIIPPLRPAPPKPGKPARPKKPGTGGGYDPHGDGWPGSN